MPLYLRDTTYAGGTNLGTTLTYGQLDGNFIFLDQKIDGITGSVITTGSVGTLQTISGSLAVGNLTVTQSLVRSVRRYDVATLLSGQFTSRFSMTHSLADIHLVNPNQVFNGSYPTMSMQRVVSGGGHVTASYGTERIVVNTSNTNPLRLEISPSENYLQFFTYTGGETSAIILEPYHGVRLSVMYAINDGKVWMAEPLGADFFASQTGSLSNTRVTGSLTVSGSVNVSGSIIPAVGGGSYTSSFSLGSSTAAWKDLWIANGTINFVDPATGVVQGTLAAPGDSIFFGLEAGQGASVRYSNFIGYHAGYNATNSSGSNFVGQNAGQGATDAPYSNFIGSIAGFNATSAQSSNFIGNGAGAYAANGYSSNFIGLSAGQNATNAYESNFIGDNAGAGATNAIYSNFIGFYAAQYATEAGYSNFIGHEAGSNAGSASYSNFIGPYAGGNALNASYSTLIGYKAGFHSLGTGIGSNNIVIGTNISLPDGTQNAINIGGIIFATGSNSDLGDTLTTAVAGGMVGIGTSTPSFTLDVSGSLGVAGTATLDGFVILSQVSASLNFADDTAAAAGGVPLGGLYRNGNFILIRLS